MSPTTNRLTDATYDVPGNQLARGVTQAAYDGFGMVTHYAFDTTNAEDYVYTASDERIGVLRNDDWIWSLRDSGGKVIRQYRSSSANPTASWLWVEDFVYRDGLLLGSERVPEEGGRRHYHLDHLGTPRLVTSALGSLISEHDVLPFGEERTAIPQHQNQGYDREEPLRFTGHERDFDRETPNDSSSYVDYMHARYYSPGAGRFLSLDPSNDDLDLARPQTWNKYAYVQNNPINRIDPDGRSARDTFFRLMKEVYNKAGRVAGFVPTRPLSKEGAIKPRQAEKNVQVSSKSASKAEKTAGEIEAAAHPGGKQKHHPAGTHGNSTGHHQTAKVEGHTFYKTLASLVVGVASPWYVDAATVVVDEVAPVVAEKGNEAIDKARKTSAFGGERRGEAAADEIIEDQ